MVFEQRYRWGRVYRDGRLVCTRAVVTIISDVRVAPSPAVPQRLQVRFLEGIDTGLRDELEQLVRSRGLRGRRLVERRLAPVEIVWNEPDSWRRGGRRSAMGRLETEVRHVAPLEQIDFRLRPDEPGPRSMSHQDAVATLSLHCSVR